MSKSYAAFTPDSSVSPTSSALSTPRLGQRHLKTASSEFHYDPYCRARTGSESNASRCPPGTGKNPKKNQKERGNRADLTLHISKIAKSMLKQLPDLPRDLLWKELAKHNRENSNLAPEDHLFYNKKHVLQSVPVVLDDSFEAFHLLIAELHTLDPAKAQKYQMLIDARGTPAFQDLKFSMG